MPTKNTISDFIRKARAVHGNRYDYSQVEYINNKTPIKIICKKHGSFLQRPDRHLYCGCLKCGIEKKKRLIRCVAYNDTEYSKSEKSLLCWLDMLRRCYPITELEKKKFSSYKDCTLHKEWLLFSNFKKWYDKHYKIGCELDKDLLSENGKCYSPSTCCFIQRELNILIQTEHKGMRNGRTKRFYNKSKGYFEPKLFHNGKTILLGKTKTEHEAISLYKKGKMELINTVAKEYFDGGIISEKIYNSFLKYKVNYANN